jgi:hypothetical protein
MMKDDEVLNFYEMKMTEEFEWRKCIKISEMIKEQTKPSIKNDLSEEFHEMVRNSVYPAIKSPDMLLNNLIPSWGMNKLNEEYKW